MSLENRDILNKAMEFILDAVALSTDGESRADIGMYLMGLVLANEGKELSPEQITSVRQIVELADECEILAFTK